MILDLQKRTRELGRIRIGQTVATSNGKTRPSKLDKFRLTSASRPLLEQVAKLYGGTVKEWTPVNGGASQWEVLTDAARLPVFVPPQPVSQYYELWSGGGCQRRCDGQTELLKDQPCVCGPDVERRACKPTTRLNVILADIPGIGVWRLESHGYYAAVELPDVAEFLAKVGGYVSAWLAIEERVVKREGEDKKVFMVPILEVDITPAQLLAGDTGGAPALDGAARPALPAGQPAPPGEGEPDWHQLIAGATTRDELLGILADAKGTGMDGARAAALEAALKARAHELGLVGEQQGDDPPPSAPAVVDDDDARDRLWSLIMAGTRFDTLPEVEQDVWRVTGVKSDEATAAHLQAYLDDGQKVPA